MLAWRSHADPQEAYPEATPVASATRNIRRRAPLAQSAERLHGKEKVYGSIP